MSRSTSSHTVYVWEHFDYSQKPNDSDKLLSRSLHDAEEGLRMRDDFGSPPAWIDKLEEAQYTISKCVVKSNVAYCKCHHNTNQHECVWIFRRVKPKLEELGSLQARHLSRPSLDDQCEEEGLIEDLSQTISKLISSTHRHIQCIRSSLDYGKSCHTILKTVVLYQALRHFHTID